MGKLFYSYRDGEVYILHKRCPLELLMFDMDKAANEFFEYVSTVTGKKC